MRTILSRYNPCVFIALALALAYHGGLLLSGTFMRTYDAFVHIFFADHYARAWFDHWEPRWYTGFTMTSYPPGSQQAIALLSYSIGLLNSFMLVQLCAVLFVVVGIYRFSRLWASDEAAGYAALLLVFSSCISETVHVFGQLPTTFSLGFLLNALPYVRRWLDTGRVRWLLVAWLVNAATTSGHHVTTLFGAVFFVAPVIAATIVEAFRKPLPDEPPQRPRRLTRANLLPLIIRRLRRILPSVLRTAVYGPGLAVALIFVVLPYWLWSRSDPITQVPIPHASRDSFLINLNAGLVFWLIPYGLTLIALPYVFYKGLTGRAWPMTLSLALLVFLGTGGTTPFPRMLLRGAFDVLTLDRFTFWAAITMMPLVGEFVVSLRHGGLAHMLRNQLGEIGLRLTQIGLLVAYLLCAIFSANLTIFRRFQPDPIAMQPIATFLAKDEHWRWRYLTLGFGDQMAWLSAQTTATSVDGNYHSARRLPELTTTPIERLEGAKFRGIPGIGSLQQFLAVPDKYNLKFVFSNDQFYDPLLFFSGWHRLLRLENGIVVWEREDIPPLPEVLPRKEIPIYQRVMWGLVPLTMVALALMAMSAPLWGPYLLWLTDGLPGWGLVRRLGYNATRPIAAPAAWGRYVWAALDSRLLRWSRLPPDDEAVSLRWQVWVDWLARLPRLRPASKTVQSLRLVSLLLIGLGSSSIGGLWYLRQQQTPEAVVLAYYDDIDFRRFEAAYARLDPITRPSLDQYLLELSVQGGLVASYGKLDGVHIRKLVSEPERVVIEARADWITSLATYPTTRRLTLVRRAEGWFIVPEVANGAIPPDQFFSRTAIDWYSQGRRQLRPNPDDLADAPDRPAIQIRSARLVKHAERYSVVGELTNTSTIPADTTIAALLYDSQGTVQTQYNAQTATIHKLLPGETTPFRIDFEGVAGAVLSDTLSAGEFQPGAFSPPQIDHPITSFAVYARAVVTTHNLRRDVAAQDIQLVLGTDSQPQLRGRLFSTGTVEATIPHILVTLYDQQGRVAWVEHAFLADAVRPQRTQPFQLALTPAASVHTVLDTGSLFPSTSGPPTRLGDELTAPDGLGYAALRVNVHAFTTDD